MYAVGTDSCQWVPAQPRPALRAHWSLVTADRMRRASTIDEATWMLILSLVVVTILISVGVVQLSTDGDSGAFFRNLGISLFLVLFSVGYYRKWRRA